MEREIRIKNISPDGLDYLFRREEEIEQEINDLEFELWGIRQRKTEEIQRIKENL